MKQLMIVGGGGFCREVIGLVECLSTEWRILGILDDAPELTGSEICGVPVLGPLAQCTEYRHAWFVIAIGAPRTRRKIANFLGMQGIDHYATLIHPSAQLSSYTSVGQGTVIHANSVITMETRIGAHNLINIGTIIGHNAVLRDYCTTAPYSVILGNVHLGQAVELGASAILTPGVQLADGCMLTAGSVLSKSIDKPDGLYVGSPARLCHVIESD